MAIKNFVLTVSQVNAYIKSVVDSDINLSSLFIKGEITNFTNHYRSGHYYMSLKDENSLIKAVVFRNSVSNLKFLPKNGMEVIARGRVSVFERDGQYQMYIDDMRPDGAGALQAAFEQLKMKLSAEGLFSDDRKKPIPRYPQTVGVITSPTGAAFQDIKNIAARRFPAAKIVLYPALVQGEKAPESITGGIFFFNRQKSADVLIVGRGGGSIEDLWAFNDEGVARAVSASEIPVISAVGHETDYTICDFAADLRAPTPSAAAELAFPDTAELLNSIRRFQSVMSSAVAAKLDFSKARYKAVTAKKCMRSPLFYIDQHGMRLDMLMYRLAGAHRGMVTANKERLTALIVKLDALSPLNVLARGYGIVRNDRGIVRHIDDVNPGDNLSIRVSGGMLMCELIEKTGFGEG